MLGRVRKVAVFLAKLAVTAGLVWWVLSGVSWNDYVVTRDGQRLRALEIRDGQVFAAPPGQAGTWRPVEDFRGVGGDDAAIGQVVHPGMSRVLGRIRPGLLVLAAAIITGQLTLMGVRWWYLMRHESLGVGLWTTVRLMYVGHFFNFFLPGSTGGDVVRAYMVTRRTKSRTVAVATVLLDRFAGLAGMAVLAGMMALATWGKPQTQRAAGAVGVALAVVVAASLVIFSRRVGRAVRLDRIIARLPRAENFRIAIRTLQSLPRSPKAAGTVGAITLGVHLLLAGAIACMGLALGLATPIPLYFLFVPVIYIVAAIPISIGGLGLVEGMYVVFFAASTGADTSAVLALALLARLTPMLLSLPGLVFWLSERGSKASAGTGETA